jgi:hypothetical protein
MKYLFYLAAFMVVFSTADAQVIQKNKNKGIPPFNIQLVNGTYFKAVDLKKDQPLMLVYFDPDCDHCRLFIDDLVKQVNLFPKVQIVLITYVPLQQVQKFVNGSPLGKCAAIRVGTEGTTFVVRYHYDIVQFPYVALHDSKGKLLATYESTVPPVKELAASLQGRNN